VLHSRRLVDTRLKLATTSSRFPVNATKCIPRFVVTQTSDPKRVFENTIAALGLTQRSISRKSQIFEGENPRIGNERDGPCYLQVARKYPQEVG
tara:strand:+ start:658 stop:939 length:282 start_codon:yes stop_codon:yes gene_type:complete